MKLFWFACGFLLAQSVQAALVGLCACYFFPGQAPGYALIATDATDDMRLLKWYPTRNPTPWALREAHGACQDEIQRKKAEGVCLY